MAVITSVIILSVMIYPGMDVKAEVATQLYIMVGSDRVDATDTTSGGSGWGYDATTNTLTLNGYSYSGTAEANYNTDTASAIYYYGDSELIINLVGSNTITLTESSNRLCGICISYGGAKITGTGSLTINLPSSNTNAYYGIEVGNGLTVDGGTITVNGGTCGINASSVVKGGTINATGCSDSGILGGTITIDGGTIKAEGSNYGIFAASGAVTINSGTVYAKGGSIGISGYTGYGASGGEYINGGNCEFIGGSQVFGDTLYNTIAGTAWDNVDGTGTGLAIPANSGYYTELLEYKKAVFPAVAEEKASDGSSEGTPASEGTELQDASGNDSGYRVTSSDASNPTVIYEGTEADKSKTTITIPDTVTDASGNVYKVTDINSGALKGSKKVKTVTVGNNVEVIGSQAFANCKKLSKVTLGSSVTKIESKAFSGDKKLKKITIKSKKLKTVQKKAFKNVSSTVTVKVPKKSKAKYTKLLKKGGLSVKATIK